MSRRSLFDLIDMRKIPKDDISSIPFPGFVSIYKLEEDILAMDMSKKPKVKKERKCKVKIIPEEIRCKRCNQVFPANTLYFYINKRHATGFSDMCIPCYIKYNRENYKKRYERNKEHIKEYSRNRYNNIKETDPEKYSALKEALKIGSRKQYEKVKEKKLQCSR